MTENKKGKHLSSAVVKIIKLLGLSCIFGSIFVTVFMFSDIIGHGYFRAVEPEPMILYLEFSASIFALLYFIYVLKSTVSEFEKKVKEV